MTYRKTRRERHKKPSVFSAKGMLAAKRPHMGRIRRGRPHHKTGRVD